MIFSKSFKNFLLCYLSLFFCIGLKAQSKKTDSLETVVAKASDDTNKVINLNLLCKELRISDNSKAIEYGKKGVQLAEKLNYARGKANAYNNIGSCYYTQGNYPVALDFYIKALKEREALGDKIGMAKSYNNIGLIYYEQGNFPLSLEYHTKSLKIKEELGDKGAMAASYGNIGNIYYAMEKLKPNKENLSKALEYHEKSLNIQTELNDKFSMSSSFNNIGNLHFELKNYPLAMDYHLKALIIQKKLGDMNGISHSLINIGSIHVKQKQYKKAIEYYKEALKASEATGSKESMKVAYEGLATCYEKLNDYKTSLQYHKLLSNTKDSLLNIEGSKQIAEVQTKFDTEKKEKEIEILKKENKIQELENISQENRLKKEKVIKYAVVGGLILLLLLMVVIYNRYKIKQTANVKLETAYHQIEHKNKEITDSIRYAKRIQEAILPPDDFLKKLLPQNFVLYKPKDIVSGDFYWVEETKDAILFAAVDCTGHGVPGAFMSIVGYNLLNQAVNEHKIYTPSLILDELNKDLSATLRQKEEESTIKDGMDISLCSLNKERNELQFAGAYNSLYIINETGLKEIKGNKFPVGIFLGEQTEHFTNHKIQVKKEDMIYVFTDGYADQFGGEKGKKFKYKQLQELLVSIHKKDLKEQNSILEKTIIKWKGDLEQIDDILIFGVRV